MLFSCSMCQMLLHIFGQFAIMEVTLTISGKGDEDMAGNELRMADCQCEFCAYYNYNEAFDDYECEVNLDEDDLARFMSGNDSSCPYFRFSDDYKIVEKQN